MVGGVGEDYFLVCYEGYGFGNCMVIVDCLIDNFNCIIKDVCLLFIKIDLKIGILGCVVYMFDYLVVLGFVGDDDEVVLEVLMMVDVDVIDVEVEDGKVLVFVFYIEYYKVKIVFEEVFEGINFEVDEIMFVL